MREPGTITLSLLTCYIKYATSCIYICRIPDIGRPSFARAYAALEEDVSEHPTLTSSSTNAGDSPKQPRDLEPEFPSRGASNSSMYFLRDETRVINEQQYQLEATEHSNSNSNNDSNNNTNNKQQPAAAQQQPRSHQDRHIAPITCSCRRHPPTPARRKPAPAAPLDRRLLPTSAFVCNRSAHRWCAR